jgi:hypothetical protein
MASETASRVSRRSFSQAPFELGEDLFDRIEVGHLGTNKRRAPGALIACCIAFPLCDPGRAIASNDALFPGGRARAMSAFFSVTPIRRKNRLIIEASALTPRSAKRRWQSA